MSDGDDRRSAQRCVKDVGMHCSVLNRNEEQLVTVRNYSQWGFYFESKWNIPSGSLIVLRNLDSRNEKAGDGQPRFEMHRTDPEACHTYRSHTLARVQRCVQLDGHDAPRLFGIGAKIQFLTD